jgi:hypothetical protein
MKLQKKYPLEVNMTTKCSAKLVVISILLMLTALSVLLSCDRRRAVDVNPINSPGKIANVLMLLSPNEVHLTSSHAVDTVQIAIAVTDSNGNGMQGVTVRLTRTPQIGLITTPDTTDFQGLSSAIFVTEPGEYDSVSITATAGNIEKRTTLYISGPSRYSLNLTYSPPVAKLIDHEGTPYTITAVIVDTTQRGIVDQAVTFAVRNEVGRLGYEDPNTTVPRTDASGEVRALFYNTELDEILLPDSAIIQAVTAAPGGGVLVASVVVPLRLVHNTLRLEASPTQLVSDGSNGIAVRAYLLDTDNHAIVGDTVKFRNIEGDGPITSQAITDASGAAAVNFTPSNRVNTVQQSHIIADYRFGSTVHQAICTTTVTLLPVRDIGFITVSLQKQNVTANGIDTTSVFITVQDSLGGLIADGTVVYLAHTGGGQPSATQAATNEGQARLRMTAPPNIVGNPRVDTIIVRSDVSDTLANLIADTAIVNYIPGSINSLQFIRPLGTVTLIAGSAEVDTVEVEATDANGNPVADGTQISFRNSLDSSSTLAPERAPTTDGRARTIYLVGPLIGDDNVIAFVPNPTNPNDTIKTLSPVVYHCISSSATTMDLRATSANIEVGGQSTQIIATLEDAFGNPLSEGYDVAFDITVAPGAGPGQRPSFDSQSLIEHGTVETNPNGQAIIQLYSGTRAGPVAIRACTVPELPESLYVCNEKSLVTISSGPPNWIRLSLEGAGESAGGATRFVQVAAIVGDTFSNPVQYNTAVYFTLIPSNMADIEGSSTTGTPRSYHPDSVNGVAYTRIIYSCFDTFKSVRVIASSAGDSALVVDTSGVFILPIFDGVLSINASPGNLWTDNSNCGPAPPYNNRDTSLVTIALYDGGGCPIENGLINFTALVAGFIIPPDSARTDQDGVARCRYYIRGCDIPDLPDGTATIETRVRASLFGVADDVSAEVNIVCTRPFGS